MHLSTWALGSSILIVLNCKSLTALYMQGVAHSAQASCTPLRLLILLICVCIRVVLRVASGKRGCLPGPLLKLVEQ